MRYENPATFHTQALAVMLKNRRKYIKKIENINDQNKS
jgi:hypothetical protein